MRSLARIVVRRADQPAVLRPLTLRRRLPRQVLVPQADRARHHRAVGVVEAQGELEERRAVGPLAGLLVGLGAHELADDGDVRVRLVRPEQIEALDEGVVVGVHPGVGRLGGHELEAEGADPPPPGHLDRVQLAARHPQRRVRPLARLGHDVAQGEVEVLAVVLPALLPEHRQEAAHGVLPHGPLVAEAPVERVQLGDAAALADAELDASVADQVERADPLGDSRRVVRRQLHDAVTEADPRRPLARRAEEHLRRRRVAVLLEDVWNNYKCIMPGQSGRPERREHPIRSRFAPIRSRSSASTDDQQRQPVRRLRPPAALRELAGGDHDRLLAAAPAKTHEDVPHAASSRRRGPPP